MFRNVGPVIKNDMQTPSPSLAPKVVKLGFRFQMMCNVIQTLAKTPKRCVMVENMFIFLFFALKKRFFFLYIFFLVKFFHFLKMF